MYIDQATVAVTLPDLPEALLHRVLDFLLEKHDVRSVILAACACTALQRTAHACLALSTQLQPPVRNCKSTLVALLPRMHGLQKLDLTSSFRYVDDDVLAALTGKTALRFLSLRSCTQITTAGLAVSIVFPAV